MCLGMEADWSISDKVYQGQIALAIWTTLSYNGNSTVLYLEFVMDLERLSDQAGIDLTTLPADCRGCVSKVLLYLTNDFDIVVRIMSKLFVICKICGKTFPVKPYKVKTARYCSKECLYEGRRKYPWTNPLEKCTHTKCGYCGEKFRLKPSDLREINYCSRECWAAIRRWNKSCWIS